MSEAKPDAGGGSDRGTGTEVPHPAGIWPLTGRAPLRGMRVLVYGLLAVFAAFSGSYSWHSVVRQRTTHLGHLADLAAVGTNTVIEERLRQLGEVLPRSPALVGIARGFRVLYPGWVGLAVRGSNKRLRVLFGSMPQNGALCHGGRVRGDAGARDLLKEQSEALVGARLLA